jgi:hypothetical protein
MWIFLLTKVSLSIKSARRNDQLGSVEQVREAERSTRSVPSMSVRQDDHLGPNQEREARRKPKSNVAKCTWLKTDMTP